ncbi:50S ribosomal protein L3 N(5)-glutamine methyltransferase [uncultured Parasutterella sp.]|uniref:50S ribosomal protein L3 N(5)-glutamine methyltransferase n=1 Tax=uncultured Parasutterella sp. TaxID=1263098 RepID=UPI0025B73D6D|nr:50S ribosomal protein L3 N(5)-glutamine methyltransferase [uncultured Parasutterella sp.]
MSDKTSSLTTIRDFIRYASTRLFESEATFSHGYDDPFQEASFLVLRSLHIPLEYEQKFLDASLTSNEREMLLNNISRRCDDLEPTAYIVHEWWLVGYRFYVDERVLIPRSFIAEMIEDRFEGIVEDPLNVKHVLDLCTGSGCLAIMLADLFPNAEVDAADISPDALEVAQINIEEYGLENRVFPMQSDVFSGLQGTKYDLIISNPPYVTQSAMESLPAEYCHEPALALEAGEDGMGVIQKIMDQAKEHLCDNGVLIVELGDNSDFFKARFPDLPVQWIKTSGGDEQVFLIKKEQVP